MGELPYLGMGASLSGGDGHALGEGACVAVGGLDCRESRRCSSYDAACSEAVRGGERERAVGADADGDPLFGGGDVRVGGEAAAAAAARDRGTKRGWCSPHS